jgi:hypothetical protein
MLESKKISWWGVYLLVVFQKARVIQGEQPENSTMTIFMSRCSSIWYKEALLYFV